MVAISSIFAIFITANFFTASYTSYLSIPDFKISVNSIEDLASNKDIKTILMRGSGTDQYIMVTGIFLFLYNQSVRILNLCYYLRFLFQSSNNPTMKKIASEVLRHPERRLEDVFFTKDISNIVKDNSALLLIKSNAESLVEQSYDYNNHTCKVTIAKGTFFSRPMMYTYPKNSPLRKPFDSK